MPEGFGADAKFAAEGVAGAARFAENVGAGATGGASRAFNIVREMEAATRGTELAAGQGIASRAAELYGKAAGKLGFEEASAKILAKSEAMAGKATANGLLTKAATSAGAFLERQGLGEVAAGIGTKAAGLSARMAASAPVKVLTGPAGWAALAGDLSGLAGNAVKALDGDYEAKQVDLRTGMVHGENVVSAGIDAVVDGFDGVCDTVGAAKHAVEEGVGGIIAHIPLIGEAVADTGGKIAGAVDTLGDFARNTVKGPLEGVQVVSNVIGVETVGAREVGVNSEERAEEAAAAEADGAFEMQYADYDEAMRHMQASLEEALDKGDIDGTDIDTMRGLYDEGYLDDQSLILFTQAVESGDVTWGDIADGIYEDVADELEAQGATEREHEQADARADEHPLAMYQLNEGQTAAYDQMVASGLVSYDDIAMSLDKEISEKGQVIVEIEGRYEQEQPAAQKDELDLSFHTDELYGSAADMDFAYAQ